MRYELRRPWGFILPWFDAGMLLGPTRVFRALAAIGIGAPRAYRFALSPNILPVVLLTRCRRVQAGQVTDS